jgi:hypothetical protein
METMSDSFEIQIDESGDGVSAEILRLQLDQILRFLHADREAGEQVEWRVTRASMNSPLTLALERIVPRDMPEPASRPGEQLARVFAQLDRGESPGEDVSLHRLHAVERMASQANGIRRIRVRAGLGDPITLDPDWAAVVRRIRIERRRRGMLPNQPYSTAGRLEGVNVHGSKSEFYVYDPLTDQRMRCLFPDDMLEEVGRSLGERVSVSGMTSFGPRNTPQAMHVESLRRIPSRSGSFLQRLESAHRRGGIDLTGGLAVDEALDEVRSGPS